MARKTGATEVEVDMIPLVDIISLLLMFLIIVGDTSARASAIKMQLPRDMDQAKTDKELEEMKLNLEGRLIVQLTKDSDGKYVVVVNNKSYDLVEGGRHKGLLDYLREDYIRPNEAAGRIKKDDKGAYDAPVKLRIPEDAPMKDVERLVMSMASAGLVNVQYAADGKSIKGK